MSYSVVAKNVSVDGVHWRREGRMILTDWDSLVEDEIETHGAAAHDYGDRLLVILESGLLVRYDRNDDRD